MSNFAPSRIKSLTIMFVVVFALVGCISSNIAPPSAADDVFLLAISPAKPDTIAWSDSGQQVGAVFLEGKDSQVRLYSADGRMLSETTVDGHVLELHWKNNGEILAAAQSVEVFSFGVRVVHTLAIWDGDTNPRLQTLSDNTIHSKPEAAGRFLPLLAKNFAVAVSPVQTDIAFSELRVPPNAASSTKYYLRDLDSGTQRLICTGPPGSPAPVYSADGDWLRCPGDTEQLSWTNLWTGETSEDLSSHKINTPSRGRSRGSNPINEKIAELRTWVLQGLISPQEYRSTREKLETE